MDRFRNVFVNNRHKLIITFRAKYPNLEHDYQGRTPNGLIPQNVIMTVKVIDGNDIELYHNIADMFATFKDNFTCVVYDAIRSYQISNDISSVSLEDRIRTVETIAEGIGYVNKLKELKFFTGNIEVPYLAYDPVDGIGSIKKSVAGCEIRVECNYNSDIYKKLYITGIFDLYRHCFDECETGTRDWRRISAYTIGEDREVICNSKHCGFHAMLHGQKPDTFFRSKECPGVTGPRGITVSNDYITRSDKCILKGEVGPYSQLGNTSPIGSIGPTGCTGVTGISNLCGATGCSGKRHDGECCKLRGIGCTGIGGGCTGCGYWRKGATGVCKKTSIRPRISLQSIDCGGSREYAHYSQIHGKPYHSEHLTFDPFTQVDKTKICRVRECQHHPPGSSNLLTDKCMKPQKSKSTHAKCHDILCLTDHIHDYVEVGCVCDEEYIW